MYTTRDKILLALNHAYPRAVSGSYLAKQLELTRAAVWKHVKALREEGFPVKADKVEGYTLAEPFDFSLLKGDLSHALRFWKVHYQFSTASTQTQAKTAAEQAASEGNLWIAEKQTSGKGRLERTWESSLGGLWLSLLLRPAIAPTRIPSLTQVAALALTQAIQSKTQLAVKLKWPNDVVVKTAKGWRKVAGILTEMSAEVDLTRWVVIGIGVNVNNHLPASLSVLGVSLHAITGKTLSRAALLKAFLDKFGSTYRWFEKSGFEPFRNLYWQQYSRPDEPVKLKTSQGVIRGIARGVDGHGALVVESPNKKTTAIWEGEIIL